MKKLLLLPLLLLVACGLLQRAAESSSGSGASPEGREKASKADDAFLNWLYFILFGAGAAASEGTRYAARVRNRRKATRTLPPRP